VSVTKEVEHIVDEMKAEKEITKKVIERIKSVHEKVQKREADREKYGELFPVFDVLKGYYPDSTKTLELSRDVVRELKQEELLSKEGFLKGSLRKEIRRAVREALIRGFGLGSNTDEIEARIFANLESDYA